MQLDLQKERKWIWCNYKKNKMSQDNSKVTDISYEMMLGSLVNVF